MTQLGGHNQFQLATRFLCLLFFSLDRFALTPIHFHCPLMADRKREPCLPLCCQIAPTIEQGREKGGIRAIVHSQCSPPFPCPIYDQSDKCDRRMGERNREGNRLLVSQKSGPKKESNCRSCLNFLWPICLSDVWRNGEHGGPEDGMNVLFIDGNCVSKFSCQYMTTTGV